MSDVQKARTYGVSPVSVLKGMSGLDFIQKMITGEIPGPPIAELLGMSAVSASKGAVTFAGTPGSQHYNPIGSIHGGYAATLLDSCMGCSVHTVLEPGQGYTTLEIKINYVRALTDKVPLVRAEGKVIHAGRRAATAEGRLVDDKGVLYAHGTTTCMIFDL
jgi:uncharacterized protein (TIGR00369 family)